MEPSGILLGLAAAACLSVSYIFSRLFVMRCDDGARRLLIASHLFLGLASAAVLPLVWSSDVPPLRRYAAPLLCSAAFYLAGQAGLFLLVRRIEVSRAAPLLGLKIPILAAIASLFLHQPLSAGQWLAVLLCVLAMLLLNASGGRFPALAAVWLTVACVGYSMSDLCIVWLVRALLPLSGLRASVLGVCLSYLVCGAAAVAALPAAGMRRSLAGWRLSAPFAAVWFLAMVFLFGCFGTIGAVYGNVVQSTRGILSVLLGAALAKLGVADLEVRASRRAVAGRLAAAVMMTLAIWLFKAGG